MSTTAHELTIIADLSYRQVDYWTRAGYLTPIGNRCPGSGGGRQRLYTDDQVALAVQMSRLVHAGIAQPAAHTIAVDLLAFGRAELDGFLIAPVATVDVAGEPLPDVVRPIRREAGAA